MSRGAGAEGKAVEGPTDGRGTCGPRSRQGTCGPAGRGSVVQETECSEAPGVSDACLLEPVASQLRSRAHFQGTDRPFPAPSSRTARREPPEAPAGTEARAGSAAELPRAGFAYQGGRKGADLAPTPERGRGRGRGQGQGGRPVPRRQRQALPGAAAACCTHTGGPRRPRRPRRHARLQSRRPGALSPLREGWAGRTCASRSALSTHGP